MTERGPGLEHVVLREERSGVRFDSSAVAVFDGVPLRLRYVIDCDRSWCVRRAQISLSSPSAQARLELASDGNGHWHGAAGEALDDFAGCLDIDLSSTPATNTLPIRRLGLRPGEAAELNVVYIPVPSLEPRPVAQRYERLGGSASVVGYRYSSGSFSAELSVDDHGLVRDYPGIWRRIALGDAAPS